MNREIYRSQEFKGKLKGVSPGIEEIPSSYILGPGIGNKFSPSIAKAL
jgi:hypothetical protein